MDMETYKQHFNGALNASRSILNALKDLNTNDVVAIKDLTDAELKTMGWPDELRPYLLKVHNEMQDLSTPYTIFKGALQDVNDVAVGVLGFEE